MLIRRTQTSGVAVVCKARAINSSVSGPIIEEKTKEFAKELLVPEFKGFNA